MPAMQPPHTEKTSPLEQMAYAARPLTEEVRTIAQDDPRFNLPSANGYILADSGKHKAKVPCPCEDTSRVYMVLRKAGGFASREVLVNWDGRRSYTGTGIPTANPGDTLDFSAYLGLKDPANTKLVIPNLPEGYHVDGMTLTIDPSAEYHNLNGWIIDPKNHESVRVILFPNIDRINGYVHELEKENSDYQIEIKNLSFRVNGLEGTVTEQESTIADLNRKLEQKGEHGGSGKKEHEHNKYRHLEERNRLINAVWGRPSLDAGIGAVPYSGQTIPMVAVGYHNGHFGVGVVGVASYDCDPKTTFTHGDPNAFRAEGKITETTRFDGAAGVVGYYFLPLTKDLAINLGLGGAYEQLTTNTNSIEQQTDKSGNVISHNQYDLPHTMQKGMMLLGNLGLDVNAGPVIIGVQYYNFRPVTGNAPGLSGYMLNIDVPVGAVHDSK